MATTPEEEREQLTRPELIPTPEYDNRTPIGTYYGEQGNTQADAVQQMINEWATKTDPQKQAEEDARIQRGRNFWTGANLFANVIANAINAGGTAKGAPNMTYNDAATQKMYEDWRVKDRELKADRRAAQQRLEALRMQDAQWRAAGAEKRAAEDKGIADQNYRNRVADIAAQNKLIQDDFTHGRDRAEKLEDTRNAQQFQREESQRSRNFQAYMQRQNREAATAAAMRRNGFDPDDKRVLVGNGYFKADNQREAESHIWNVFQMVRDAWNADDGTGNPRVSVPGVDNGYMPDTSDINTAYSYVAKYFRNLYQPGSAFKTNYDTYFSEYGANAASHPSGRGQQGGNQNNQGGGFRL